jgi:hypothetical protein
MGGAVFIVLMFGLVFLYFFFGVVWFWLIRCCDLLMRVFRELESSVEEKIDSRVTANMRVELMVSEHLGRFLIRWYVIMDPSVAGKLQEH